MIAFIFNLVFRVVSGAQNGAFYAKSKIVMLLFTVVLVGLNLLSLFVSVEAGAYREQAMALNIVAYICFAISAGFAVALYFVSWKKHGYKYIHLFELITVSAFLLAWVFSGGNLIYIACSVYPALILHKGAVNIGGGHNFWYHGTDDPTGQVYTIPVLGWSVPRMSLKFRLIVAFTSLMIVLLNLFAFEWELILSKVISVFCSYILFAVIIKVIPSKKN
jgi:hypothetical protein